MASIKSSESNGATKSRVPNAFMIFVKEKTQELLQKCSEDEKASLGAYLGRKWRSMTLEEKQVYFEKYKALKALEDDPLDSDPSMVGASTDEVNMKLKSVLAPSSAKQKPSKKARRPPNGFMIFAQEHRHTLDPSVKKDKNCHTNTILGNMWRELTGSQREKYLTEARRLLDLHKMSEPGSSRKIQKKKKQVRFEIAPKKPVGRRPKKKKEAPCSDSTNIRNQEVKDDGRTEMQIESSSNKPPENVENAGIINTASEPRAFSSNPSLSHLHQHNGAMGPPLHPMPSSMEPRHSSPCCSCFNSGASSYQTSNSGFPGMSGSCFGAASFPPSFGSYPFNVSPWMYHQSMAHQWFPYPPPSFYPSPYSYCFPYSYNNAHNGYINYYQAQYSRRVVESTSSSYASTNPTTPATATNASSREESAEAEKTDENSDDEQLVIDEGDPNEKEPQDGTH